MVAPLAGDVLRSAQMLPRNTIPPPTPVPSDHPEDHAAGVARRAEPRFGQSEAIGVVVEATRRPTFFARSSRKGCPLRHTVLEFFTSPRCGA